MNLDFYKFLDDLKSSDESKILKALYSAKNHISEISENSTALLLLERLMTHSEEDIRERANMVSGVYINTPILVDALITRSKLEKSEFVMSSITKSLSSLSRKHSFIRNKTLKALWNVATQNNNTKIKWLAYVELIYALRIIDASQYGKMEFSSKDYPVSIMDVEAEMSRQGYLEMNDF